MIKNNIKKIDRYLSEKFFNLGVDKPFVIILCLHKIFPNSLPDSRKGDPKLGITMFQLEMILKYFSKRGYRFISDEELLNLNSESTNKFVMITFDDGYYNNMLILPLLKKYNAKAVLYITTDNCINQKNFWWESLHRNLSKEDYENVCQRFLELKWQDQEVFIIEEFGEDAVYTLDDSTRPMNKMELKKIARSPHIRMGNHTTHHHVLPLYDRSEIESMLYKANDQLEEISDASLCSIAYPHGLISQEVLETIHSCKLQLGMGLHPKKEKLPIQECFNLGRYIIFGDQSIIQQCHNIHIGVSLINKIKQLL